MISFRLQKYYKKSEYTNISAKKCNKNDFFSIFVGGGL